MKPHWKIKIDSFLNKAIIFNLYLFALGLLTSKGLTSIGGSFICIFGLLQLIVMRVNPFKAFTDKILNLPILFFTIALFLAIIEHPDAEALRQIQKHLLLFYFFYIAVFNIHDLKQIKKLLLFASISMAIAAFYGLYQHYFLNMSRVNSFSFSLAFGCLLAIFIIFLLVYGLWGKISAGFRVGVLIGAAFLGINLLFTQARGAWLGFLSGIFTLAWLKSKKILLLVVVICLISYLFLPQFYIDRFISIFDFRHNFSNVERLALWKSSLLMYRDHYINGVGLGRFTEQLESNYMQPVIETTCHAHNNILQFTAEAGTFGLVGFIWLMTAIVIWLYKNYQTLTNHNWRLFLLASLCGVIVFNIQGLTEVNYGDAETIRFFWFLMAINAAIIKLNKNHAGQIEQQLSSN